MSDDNLDAVREHYGAAGLADRRNDRLESGDRDILAAVFTGWGAP